MGEYRQGSDQDALSTSMKLPKNKRSSIKNSSCFLLFILAYQIMCLVIPACTEFIVCLIPAFIFLLVLLQGDLCIVWGCLLLSPGLWCHPLNSVEWILSDCVHFSRCQEHGYFKPYFWLEDLGVTQVIWNQQHEMTFIFDRVPFLSFLFFNLKLYFLI